MASYCVLFRHSLVGPLEIALTGYQNLNAYSGKQFYSIQVGCRRAEMVLCLKEHL